MDKQQAIEEAARESLKPPTPGWRDNTQVASDAIGHTQSLGATHDDIHTEMRRQSRTK